MFEIELFACALGLTRVIQRAEPLSELTIRAQPTSHTHIQLTSSAFFRTSFFFSLLVLFVTG